MHKKDLTDTPMFGVPRATYQNANRPESGKVFRLTSEYRPSGDQPQAISGLCNGLNNNEKNQVLLGVTGSGKTYTMANIIHNLQRPALIMAHNKTLAAQLYSEMKSFFPENAVEYFVSYYDYYQPEAYVPRNDLFIEKEATINEQIDRMRHSATRSLLERDDVIIVASVSCIYGIGPVEMYAAMIIDLSVGEHINQRHLMQKLIELQYARNDAAFTRGKFRVRGDTVEVHPSNLENHALRFNFFGDEIEEIWEFNPLTGEKTSPVERVRIYANTHYVVPRPTLHQATKNIRKELTETLQLFRERDKLVEAQRLEQRTTFDLEMMMATGTCNGIENYSRWLTGREPDTPPPTLFEYIPSNTILFIDESHVTVKQISAMYKGDRSRKTNLSEYGFRLPSCKDNRPLKFEEWEAIRPQSVFVSATPSQWELEQTNGIFTEQVIRPTGLVDPDVAIHPAENQVDHLMEEAKKEIKDGGRILVTTLTKRMAEDLTEYLQEHGLQVRYLHSDIDTLERVEIIRELRVGTYDILVGINLLREGLDIPECTLVAILDADKEGFLRSTTSLIQTIGRAARNVKGRVICYADTITKSLTAAINEMDRRREKQTLHNTKHNITPQTIQSRALNLMGQEKTKDTAGTSSPRKESKTCIISLEKAMMIAADNLEFEKAADLRDKISQIRQGQS